MAEPRKRRGARRRPFAPDALVDRTVGTQTDVRNVTIDGTPVEISFSTTGPRGYVERPLPAQARAIQHPGEVAVGEVALLKGRVEVEVLGFADDGLVRVKTVVTEAMPQGCADFCVHASDLVKKAGTP